MASELLYVGQEHHKPLKHKKAEALETVSMGTVVHVLS